MLDFPLFGIDVAKFLAVKTGTIGNGYDWGQATLVTICGFTIVFAMLILLVIVILIFGKIMDKANGITSEKTVKPAVNTPVASSTPMVTTQDDNDEIIAVIAAAVNEIYADSNVKPVIRRIIPSDLRTTRSPWASAGVFENTRAF